MGVAVDGTGEAEVTSEVGAGYGETVLSGLKDFQRRTAEFAFERLYRESESTRRFLIADEVGLGKTLVAAGVIAQAIDHLRLLDTPRIDVIYICSNQAIARQNVERIKHRLSMDTRPLAERITLLPYRLDTLDQRVNLIALTPGTSFNSASAEGVVEERVILFRMLTRAWGDLGQDARLVFLGSLSGVARFRHYEYWYPDKRIDGSIVEQFRRAVGPPGSELHCEFTEVRDRLSAGLDANSWRLRSMFVAKLRRLLAHACLDALEPDLVILDEFQRFRDLLDPTKPSGELAQRLFEYEDSHTKVRTLLLSATPYKMYTLSHETEDDHYKDFLQTVDFLEGPGGSVESLEESLREFRSALPRAAADGDIDVEETLQLSEHRDSIRSALLRVMSRTERRGRESGGDPMLTASEMPVDLQVDDVQAYLGAREVAAAVDAPGVMEYWKSTPYLLSFMDRYRLSERLRARVESEPNGAVAQLIRRGSGLQMERRDVEDRRSIAGGNGRMRALLRDLSENHLHDLLWLPPSLPEYPLGREFELARPTTKRLVFSSWAMVPRAVAVMASYDAERRHIPDSARAARYEAQLLGVTGTSYSLFSLLAPSAALADAGDPLSYPGVKDASTLLRSIQERLRPEVERLIRAAPTEGQPQEIWYAIAPLLLDRQSPGSLTWLHGPPATRGDADDRESAAWLDLAARVRDGLSIPGSLGRPPRDLLEVMALLAVGSPANATLRALSRITSTSPAGGELKRQAMGAAHAFRSLFRAPTSEGLLRNVYTPDLEDGDGPYWRRVLAYAIEGGLSAVLDEYFHVIRDSGRFDCSAADLVSTLSQALQLAARPLAVSEWEDNGAGVQRRTYPMRQHLARRYVNDGGGAADQQANQRLDDIRASFNSPFWPFVLGTTSIGQEGLDFHWYCHAVVHWNLPPNPVDLEQREGRVHRYHGHAIRKNIAQAVGSRAIGQARYAISPRRTRQPLGPWFTGSRTMSSQADGGLVPHWVFTEGDARIQRHSPVLPLSRDADRVVALRQVVGGLPHGLRTASTGRPDGVHPA